ncbi:MAG: hypothetical protein MI702_10795, partial [Chlorobiales bacterium]|nr:hypothetical protein [Chlorobiales bacterium]
GTNGSDLNTGKSVEQAFATIQHALNVAQSGETVVVMDGTYTGPGNKELNFLGKAIYLTSQNGPSHTIIDCQSSGRAFFFHSGEQTDSVVDGFTLANGNSPVGGAIYCLFSGPTLKHLVLVNNYGANGGGAIRCEYGNNPPHVLNCTFYNNSTTGFGGGLYAGNGIQPQLTNCILWNNTAASGHQLAVINTTVSVSFCAVQGGQAGVLQQGGFAVWGDGNIENDPLIVAPNDLSVTLSSERGRYWAQYDLWVIDEQTSPCIDAGDPALNVANEPSPNGERINMGAHGSTAFASLSPIEEEECFQLDYNDDGLIELQDLFDMMEAWLDAWEAALIMPQTPS